MARAFERPAAIARPGSDTALDGLQIPGPEAARGAAVIAPPHPLYGGRMDNPVVTEIALAAERAGLGSLRFDWRGAGASAGTATEDPTAADEDYAAALAFLAESEDAPLVAAGYSFGAAAALRAARDPRVRRVLLVAPPPSLCDRRLLEDLRIPVWIGVGERDSLAPARVLRDWIREQPSARLEVIEDTDHFFGSGLVALGRRAAAWLRDPS